MAKIAVLAFFSVYAQYVRQIKLALKRTFMHTNLAVGVIGDPVGVAAARQCLRFL